MFFVVRALFNDFCFCFFIKYIITQKGNAEIAGGGYDHFEECVLKIKQKTFISRTALLYVPSKPVKVVRPIGKRQGALHIAWNNYVVLRLIALAAGKTTLKLLRTVFQNTENTF